MQFVPATSRLGARQIMFALILIIALAFACSNDEVAPTQAPQQPEEAAPAAPAQLAATSRPAATPRPADRAAEALPPTPGPTATPLPTSTPVPRLTGEILIDGSSTVFPVTQAAAEEFRKTYPNVQIPVGISGTGGGFKKFSVGETVISDASRPIKDSEREAAVANGIEFIELTVALDGLSVMVNPSNDFADCLTTEELRMIWEPGSSVDNWSQVRSEFPDRGIVLYGPDADSGTFDYFTDEINGEEGAIRREFFPAVDDNVLVQGIAGDSGALGYFGYAYYIANQDKLKLVAVDSGDGCVYPTDETVNNGTYSPLSRPLFIYVNIASLDRPEVRAFVDFYLENGADLAAGAGYVGLSKVAYDDLLALVANPVADVK